MTGLDLLDHLVLATPDVAETRAWLEDATGIQPSIGGPHIERGTCNVLCSFGPDTYLEIIGPDPDQPEPVAPRPFGVDHVTEPTLVTWCARPVDLDEYVQRAARDGVRYSTPEAMSRRSPDGLLEWRLSFLESDDHGGIVPFVIDWGATRHPAGSVTARLELVSFEAGHPDPNQLPETLAGLGVALPVQKSERLGLHAVVAGPAGLLQLRA